MGRNMSSSRVIVASMGKEGKTVSKEHNLPQMYGNNQHKIKSTETKADHVKLDID